MTNPQIKKRQASPLKLARVNACMTQKELAQAVGVSQQSLSRHERGESFPAHFLILRKYEEVLSVPMRELFPELFEDRLRAA